MPMRYMQTRTMIRNLLHSIFLSVAALGGLSAQQVITLSADQDNTIYSDRAGNANGSGVHFIAGNTNQGHARRALIRFDLEPLQQELAAGDRILSAELELNANKGQGGAQSFSIHPLTKAWGEGSERANNNPGKGTLAASGSATWDSTGTTAWDASGGDYLNQATTTFSVGGNGSVTATGLASDVIQWNEGLTNHGWIIIGDESSNQTAWRFDSREGNNPPELKVTISAASSSGDALAKPELQLFPNPAQDQVQVSGLPVDARYLVIYDALGRQVHHRPLSRGEDRVLISLAHFHPGVYWIRAGLATDIGKPMRLLVK